MPSTDRRLEFKEKTSMAQTVWQPAMYANGLREMSTHGSCSITVPKMITIVKPLLQILQLLIQSFDGTLSTHPPPSSAIPSKKYRK